MADTPDRDDPYLRRIVDTLPVTVCRWRPDTTLTYVNARYEELIAGRSDIVGERWLRFVPEEERARVEVFYRELAAQPRTVTFEHEVVGSDGETRTFSWTDQPVLDEHGELVEFQSIGVDITEQRAAEEDRRRLEAQLRQSHKMEAVGRLAGGVAHDFNNMLGVILGRAEVALDAVEPESEAHEDLQEIQDAARRSVDLTRQLLTYARRQPISPVPLDMDQRIEGLLRMLRRLVGEDIELVWRPRDEPWLVRADPGQLDQTVVNLVVNARDAILALADREAGDESAAPRITLETANVTLAEGDRPDADDPDPDTRAPGDYVVLTVTDTGAGIDPDRVGQVFEPFYTTKGVGRGSGLGLATVYGMVKQHGGFIDVESEPQGGTAFRLHFPRDREGAPAPRPEPPAEAGAPADGSHTILVVEDETSLLRVTERFLERLGYAVLTAATPGEALERSRRHDGGIDLLLTDVVLPEMNGRQLYEQLRSERPDLECLYMSGYPAEAIARHGVLEEGVRLIHKPFTLPDLATRVGEALIAAREEERLRA